MKSFSSSSFFGGVTNLARALGVNPNSAAMALARSHDCLFILFIRLNTSFDVSDNNALTGIFSNSFDVSM